MTESSNRPSAPHTSAPYQRWLAEMKRRRVFRVIAVYGAVSFVVLEAASVVFPAIPLPDWSISLVLWMVILGFPFAVVLAWAFELTPDGVKRTEAAGPAEIESIVAAPALTRWPPGLLALGGLVLLAVAFYGGKRSAPGPADGAREPSIGTAAGPDLAYVDLADDPRPAIAVLPFADMKLIEWFEDGAVELYDLASDLSERHDLAADRPEDTRRLLEQLRAWRDDLGANMPTEP